MDLPLAAEQRRTVSILPAIKPVVAWSCLEALLIATGSATEEMSAPASSMIKATDFNANRKPVLYHYLLVNNTNLHPLSHRLQVINFSLSTWLYLSLTCLFIVNPRTNDHKIRRQK